MLANLKDVLIPAREGHYAVGLFNTTDTDMLEAAISAADCIRRYIQTMTATGFSSCATGRNAPSGATISCAISTASWVKNICASPAHSSLGYGWSSPISPSTVLLSPAPKRLGSFYRPTAPMMSLSCLSQRDVRTTARS